MTPATPVIVVGVDGSEGSTDALRWAAGQAAADRGGATRQWRAGAGRATSRVSRRAPTRRATPSARLHEIVAPVRDDFPDLDISEHVVQGPAGPSLLTQSENATLLVVGARGRAAFPGMLLGSVAEYCVRNGPCPVVVVRTLPR